MGNHDAIQAIKRHMKIADSNLRRAIEDGDLKEARRQLAIKDRYKTALKNEYDKNDRPHPNVRTSPYKS
jgi:hypothetical protein